MPNGAQTASHSVTDAATGTQTDFGSQSKGSLDLAVMWSPPLIVDFAWVMRDVLQPNYEFIEGSGGGKILARSEFGAAIRWNPESVLTIGWSQLDGRGESAISAGIEIWFYDVFAIRSGLDAELSDDAVAAILDFFDTPAGERIVALEVAARRAMLDEAVEETAREGWMALEADGGARWELLIEFAEVNDLVESNVAGAMTSNYAFYMGLIDGRAFDFEMTEDQVLTDVWSQEQAIREETVDWVFSFTSLAYQPLSDAEFAAYVEFTATPEGRALNAALFSAFNKMFTEISRELGLGASRFLSGQDI